MIERQAGGFGFAAGSWPLNGTKSTLVFIHGAAGSAVFWQSQLDGLAQRANTVALDLPGHGRSRADGQDRVAEYVRSVLEFMDAIEVPAPIPCGLSMGGAITQQLLLDHAERFRAGILISTGAKLKVLPLMFETIPKDYPGFVAMLGRFAASQKTDPDKIESFLQDAARCRPDVALGDLQACNGFDVMDRLPEIEVPVLVLTAEDDRLTPPKYGEFLEKSMRNATRVHIADAGHIAPMEQPTRVNQAIVEFLDRIGQ